MENILDALTREIALAEQRLSTLKDSRDRLQKLQDGQTVGNNRSFILPQQFASKTVGEAVRDYLMTKGGVGASDDKDSILEALLAGGCDMGRYPKRACILGIRNYGRAQKGKGPGPTGGAYFEIRGNTVFLRR